MEAITQNNFTRVNNDTNGNPRYVIHFLDSLLFKKSGDINELYNKAIKKAKTIGGKIYRVKEYGGGIVFTSYNLQDLANKINKLKIC